MQKKNYYRQLDSLRAIAVAGVAWHHWMPQYNYGLPFLAGVQLFFVLSGFLITGILLKAKENNEEFRRERKGFILRNFYCRRFLRIFPLYYAVLIIALLLNVSHLQETYLWHFLYASNFYFIFNQGWEGTISHFWTLAVEEQFYIFWPFVVLFIRRKYLPLCFILFALLGPIYQVIGFTCFPEVKLWSLATPGSFDSLALGALLAYFTRYPSRVSKLLLTHRRKLLLLSFLFYALISFTRWLPPAFVCMERTLLSIVFTVFIHEASLGIGGVIGKILNFGPFVYLGKISYGLYVLHNFAIIPQLFLYNHFEILKAIPGSGLFLKTFFTVAGAALSWHFFEAPINQMKKRFPYNRKE